MAGRSAARVPPTGATTAANLVAGAALTATWNITVPSGPLPPLRQLGTTATYQRQNADQRISDSRIVRNPPTGPQAPTSDTDLSALPFLGDVKNGYGPVERHSGNGNQNPGDGRPLKLATLPGRPGPEASSLRAALQAVLIVVLVVRRRSIEPARPDTRQPLAPTRRTP
ncbi:hypothetical protein OG689_05980 [Kitasatospora sp. NBC_00240]|uniref:hypothetical protein n=1 Tax=Kitasatospora sp. NBC_00240 TaxID=2903567 RepID=UPI00224E7770|nr:hypothetical protein [Kitasatospora sp. NBC_00240]MCX5208844.1 hypothetical protein [Kitasatospora sp. NBC_00240]